YSRMSISTVRGPNRTVRTRPRSASIRLASCSSFPGDRVVATRAAMLRKSSCSGPPTGAVRYTPDTASTLVAGSASSRSTACCRFFSGSPRLLPSPRKANTSLRLNRLMPPPLPAQNHRHRAERLVNGCLRFADPDGHRVHSVERQRHLAQVAGQCLNQLEPRPASGGSDLFGEQPVV